MIDSVIGSYRIDREIGEGGMSRVYVGRTIQPTDTLPVNYEVVLKIMSEELAGEITARKRFVKEAQILSKLRHRYITRFYEFINNDRNAVLVMEFVEELPSMSCSPRKARCPSATLSGSRSVCSKPWSTRTARASSIATSNPRI